MAKYLTLKQSPTVRWVLTILWSILTLILFLTPSGDGTPVTFISELFGGTTLTDAIGHVIIHSALSFLWLWTAHLYIQDPARMIISGGVVLATTGELLQLYIPGRGSSLLDMVANSIGIFIGVWLYYKFKNFLEESET